MVNRRVLILGASLISSVVLVAVVVVIAVVSGFAYDISRAASLRSGFDPPPSRELPMEDMIRRSDFIAVVNLESVSRGVEKFASRFILPCRDRYSMTLDYTFEVEEYLKGAGEARIVATVLNPALARTPVGALLYERPDKNRRTTWDDRKAIVFLERDSESRLGLSSLIWKPGRYFLADTDEYDRYSVANGYKAWLPAVSASPDEQTFLLESDQNKASPKTITLDEIKAMVPTLPHETVDNSHWWNC